MIKHNHNHIQMTQFFCQTLFCFCFLFSFCHFLTTEQKLPHSHNTSCCWTKLLRLCLLSLSHYTRHLGAGFLSSLFFPKWPVYYVRYKQHQTNPQYIQMKWPNEGFIHKIPNLDSILSLWPNPIHTLITLQCLLLCLAVWPEWTTVFVALSVHMRLI